MRPDIKRLDAESASAALACADFSKPVIFVGAGISFASGLPLAFDLKVAILEILCAGTETTKRLWLKNGASWGDTLKSLMLEVMLQTVVRHYPQAELTLASLFLIGTPTHYHHALAALLSKGLVSGVVTTNFDNLIENAYANLRQAGAEVPALSVIITGDEEVQQSTPVLIKIHGCATKPQTMTLTLSHVGKGLELWKRKRLEKGSLHPFIFIGYSDRDKDITPVLSSLKNPWVWILHDTVPPEEHIPAGSALEQMLSLEKRLILHTNTDSAFLYFVEKAVGPLHPLNVQGPSPSWRDMLISLVGEIDPPTQHLILADILYEQIGDSASAEEVYTSGLELGNLSQRIAVELILRRNRVYGDRWDTERLEAHLSTLPDLFGSIEQLPTDLQALITRQWAVLFQKQSIKFSERSETYFADEEKMWRLAGKTVEAALAKMNRAVVLQKRGKYNAAMPVYTEAISELRTTGDLSLLAKALVNYGSLLGMTGKNEQALDIYREASEVFFMIGDYLWAARLEVNIGNLLSEIGQRDSAIRTLEKALETLTKFQDDYWARNAVQSLQELRGDGEINGATDNREASQ